MNSAFYIHDFEPSIYRHRGVVEFRILEPTVSRNKFSDYLKAISSELGMQPHPEQPEPIITSATGHTLQKHNGLEGMLFWLESGLHAYYWERPQLITLDMHSCSYLDKDVVERVSRTFFKVCEYFHLDLLPANSKTDSEKVEVRTNEMSRGVYATEPIRQGEFIAGFYGEIYEAESAMMIPPIARNHAIQFGDNKWRDSPPNGLANILNHSCEPNCGIKGLFDLVAMRDIEVGEELCWDYAMTEDSNWEVPGGKCLCGTTLCRGTITPYRDLPQSTKDKYKDYTSDWIKYKYNRADFSAVQARVFR